MQSNLLFSLNIRQNKTKLVIIFFLSLASFLSISFISYFSIYNYTFATTSSFEQTLQQSQQDLQSMINEQVQQTFNNTIKSINSQDNDNESIIKNNTIKSIDLQNNILITAILAKNLENHIEKAGAIMNITSELPQVRNLTYINLLNQTLDTLHGIPQNMDVQKREVAKSILSSESNFFKIFFILSNGDMYLLEPYLVQQNITATNYAFRDYFQGAIKNGGVYLGDVIISTAASRDREAVIAIPVYSLNDNDTVIGVWGGSIDFNILNKELQSFNFLNSLVGIDNGRVVYLDNNGQKVADSDIGQSKIPESFANLTSFENAISGQSGSTTEILNGTNILVTYHPVKAFYNTWAVLLIQQEK